MRLPLSAAAGTLILCAWAGGLVMLTLPLYNGSLPSGGVLIGGTVFRGAPTEIVSAVIGCALLLAAPQLTRALAAADLAVSGRLLRPPSDLAARVTELERSRERVVDAAEAERQRIERDLHDGAQQRLVALRTGGGDLDATRLTGRLRLASDGGDIGADALASPNVIVSTGGGDITLTFIRPPGNVQVNSGGGDIQIVLPGGDTAYNVATSTGGGDLSNSVPVSTSSANTITVNSGGGDIDIT